MTDGGKYYQLPRYTQMGLLTILICLESSEYMGDTLVEQVLRKIDEAALLYHRLVLLVAPAGNGKTLALQTVHQVTGAPMVNVNLELSRCMLELTTRQRVLKLPRLLTAIVNEPHSVSPTSEETVATLLDDMVLLDNIEVLFDVLLQQDPLRLLLGLSRNKIIVATWNGSVAGTYLVYATPEHPEYRRYPIRDFLVVSPTMMV